MPAYDQLEIIAPDGEIKFFDLSPGRGITNIGRHPENDLVIDNPAVAPFHAVLDHRNRPYQLVVVTQEHPTKVGGQPVQANIPHTLNTWDTIELNGHSLVLIESEGELPSRRTGAPLPMGTAAAATAAGVAAGAAAMAATAGAAQPGTALAVPPPPPTTTTGAVFPRLATPPPELTAEEIVVEATERDWVIDVEDFASTQVTIGNGGDRVAAFVVQVEGIDPGWVRIDPPSINLFEGERGTIGVSISPPRHSSSRAGTYYLSLVVTSPDYPGKVTSLTATLVINPYYEYAVGEISPRQQTVTWRRQLGRAALPVANRGNSECSYRLDGEDDERGVRFEFNVPGEGASLLGHAEMKLQPDTAITIPIRLTPHKRRFFGVGKHNYMFTVTTTPLAGAQTPRAVLGQLAAAPLIGPWFVVLCLILLAVLIAIIFRPRVNYFGTDPDLTRENPGTIQITAGESVPLYWRASPWTGLTLESTLEQDPSAGALRNDGGPVVVEPIDDATYTLRGRNLLTNLWPSFFSDSRTVKINVQGVEPGMYFTATVNSGLVNYDLATNTITLVRGGSVTLSWNVVRTDELFLLSNGAAQSISDDSYVSSQIVAPEVDTTYQLRAINHYNMPDGKISAPITVKVVAPSPTPLPIPVIQRFDVQPKVITVGESIRLDWLVTGVTEVTIVGVDGIFAPSGSIEVALTTEGTRSFILSATNGEEPVTLQQIVTVLPAPTATPEPVAPRIEFFTITPDTVVAGTMAASEVSLAWSVVGATTNIVISGPDFGTVENLNRQGNIKVAVTKPTLFVLTAFNGDDLSTSATVQINVIPPTPTPLPVPIVIFSAVPDPGHAEPANSVIQITSGTIPSNTQQYQVIAGTWVQFSWTATGAVKAVFSGVDKAPVDTHVVQVIGPQTFLFSAINAQGSQTDLFIQVLTTPRPAPPAPFGVSGAFDAVTGQTILLWQYSTSFLSSIDYFRVYRVSLPGNNFVLVADNIPKTLPYTWTDTAATCDMAYYAVAVYTDLNGSQKETAPSTNSWYSPACPLPSPTP